MIRQIVVLGRGGLDPLLGCLEKWNEGLLFKEGYRKNNGNNSSNRMRRKDR